MVEAWCDQARALAVTGVEVTDAQLGTAQATVEVMCGRTYADTVRFRPRDLHWLESAVAYQAVWAAQQPGLESRMDITSTTQDSVSAAMTADAVVLAPMAARAINRLSWRRGRTLHVRSPFVDGHGPWLGPNPLLEAHDEVERWTPMGDQR